MEILSGSTQKILTSLLRHTTRNLTISMLEEILAMTHVGVWKALKKLENADLVVLQAMGNKKNSAYIAHLNWENRLTTKILSLALEHEAIPQRRWVVNFAALENKVDFLLLYGSMLVSPQKAKDIDLLSVVSKKNISLEVERILMNVQKTQSKPIHHILLSPVGLKDELKKPNIAFINALKEGVVLFGQDAFIAFMRKAQQ